LVLFGHSLPPFPIPPIPFPFPITNTIIPHPPIIESSPPAFPYSSLPIRSGFFTS
jgi:hypothetical protein